MWKQILKFPNYEVNEDGTIRNIATKKIIMPQEHKGYLQVNLIRLSKNKKHNIRRTVTVHRLVAEAFVVNPKRKPQVNHKDGNKLNNNVSNLEWVTAAENIAHSVSNGLNNTYGSNNVNAKLKEEDIPEIKRRCSENEALISIALDYGVSIATISLIKHNRIWRNV